MICKCECGGNVEYKVLAMAAILECDKCLDYMTLALVEREQLDDDNAPS